MSWKTIVVGYERDHASNRALERAAALTSRHQIAAHWRALLPSWRSIALMGALGFTGFNALFYAAAHHTTAINIAISKSPFVLTAGDFPCDALAP